MIHCVTNELKINSLEIQTKTLWRIKNIKYLILYSTSVAIENEIEIDIVKKILKEHSKR